MSVSPEEAATIEAVAALTGKFAEVINFEDPAISLNALADVAALLITDANDPESVRDQFVAALDATLDTLTFMPAELRR